MATKNSHLRRRLSVLGFKVAFTPIVLEEPLHITLFAGTVQVAQFEVLHFTANWTFNSGTGVLSLDNVPVDATVSTAGVITTASIQRGNYSITGLQASESGDNAHVVVSDTNVQANDPIRLLSFQWTESSAVADP
jgi:hypothetical protein